METARFRAEGIADVGGVNRYALAVRVFGDGVKVRGIQGPGVQLRVKVGESSRTKEEGFRKFPRHARFKKKLPCFSNLGIGRSSLQLFSGLGEFESVITHRLVGGNDKLIRVGGNRRARFVHLGGSGLGRLSLATESQDCTSGAKAGQQHAFVCVHGFLLIMKTSVSSSGRHPPIRQDFMAYPPFFPAGAENNNPAKRCQLKISLN